ncbi:unnamed protein product, partial [Urochloa humidicola]
SRTQDTVAHNAASGGGEMHPRRRPAAVVVVGGGSGGLFSRRGSTEKAFPRRGGLVVPPGVVGRGGRSRRGGADRLPPPLRVRQRHRIRHRLPRIPPDVKSMVSAGLTTLPCSSYDLPEAASGQDNMKILCIGHGGGNLPLFLASKFRGASIHIVEIDPVVVSASIEAMGFPKSSVKDLSSESMLPADADDLLWGGIHDRISLHVADADDFIASDSNQYDLVFIDAYDGDDIFPRKLWDAEGTFMKNLEKKVHPVHGTVVVNLHSDAELPDSGVENVAEFQSILPMGKHVSQVCRAYKEHFGFAFTSAVPWLCNVTLVACRDKAITSGPRLGLNHRDFILGKLLSNSDMVERALDLPFPCLAYIKNGFTLVE